MIDTFVTVAANKQVVFKLFFMTTIKISLIVKKSLWLYLATAII